MDKQGIFLIRSDKSIVVLKQQPYEKEDLLQAALAEYPAVLAGGVTGSDEQTQLLLVRREMGIPKAESGGHIWSLDHLFLDREGVPVVVEVKRASDTRIRREVVGQMLDYAANAVKYWPIRSLRDALEETALAVGSSAEELVHELRPDLDPEQYWDSVAGNLTSGRVRMVFVADSLPDELVRIIEFLNEQMSPAEVLGVEVPQFVGEGLQLLVPRLVGNTANAVAAKGKTAGVPWNETTYLAEATERCTPAEVALLQRLFDHVKVKGEKFGWGRGVSPGVSGWYLANAVPTAAWTANTGAASPDGRAYIYFYLPDMKKRLRPDRFAEVVAALSNISCLQAKLEEAKVTGYERKYPSTQLMELLGEPGGVDQLFAALDCIAAG